MGVGGRHLPRHPADRGHPSAPVACGVGRLEPRRRIQPRPVAPSRPWIEVDEAARGARDREKGIARGASGIAADGDRLTFVLVTEGARSGQELQPRASGSGPVVPDQYAAHSMLPTTVGRASPRL